MGVREGGPEGAGRYAALVAGLKERGWIDGDTAKLETWWAGGSIARIREIVPELVASAPDEGQPGLGTLIKLAPTRDLAEVETTLAALAATTGASVIIPTDPFNASNGVAIVRLVERFRLPAVYTYRQLAIDGGLMAYGPDTFAAFHQTADYVDRVLRGEKPSDLPAQAPTKYQLVLNLQTARKFNLMFPQTLLAVADEVVE
jgi:hypothetical protein